MDNSSSIFSLPGQPLVEKNLLDTLPCIKNRRTGSSVGRHLLYAEKSPRNCFGIIKRLHNYLCDDKSVQRD
jgi:hypothetical protein